MTTTEWPGREAGAAPDDAGATTDDAGARADDARAATEADRIPGRPDDAAGVAAAILETVPGVMRAIRSQMRAGREDALTVPQFRALLYVRRHPSTSLSGISEHLGQSQAAASELVERLVRAGLVVRRTNEQLRRKVCVDLTPAGSSVVEATERGTRAWLRDRVAGLEGDRRANLVRALGDLRRLIGDERGEPGGERGAERGEPG